MISKIKKPLAAILCCTILAGGVSATIFAMASGKEQQKTKENPVLPAAENEADLVKDETVYVLAGADGSVKKIIVSDWIKNAADSNAFSDKSELTNVENVKGDESYTMNSNHMRVWDAQGNDIYYQGNIEKELPVNLSVSYKLDGKNISSEELAGKSGKVTIRFDYKNNQYDMVDIDGKQEKMYVPFAMITGMILDNDTFTNVDVSNGKLINDGSRTVIIGIAFPGLQSNLNIDKDKLEISDYVEITANVKNFEMANTATIATNEIFTRLNTDELDSVDKLNDSLDELTGAMNQLINGSSQLYDGLCTLLDKSEELVNGINQLADGAAKLKNGAEELNHGAADLADGAQTLAGGLGQLTDNNSTLNAGAKQVFDSLLNMANTQLATAGLNVPVLTIENYAEILNGVITSLDTTNVAKEAQAVALQKVTAAVNEQKDAITAAVTAAVNEQVIAKISESVRENIETQVLASKNMTKEQYVSAVKAGMITAEQQEQIGAAIDMQMQSAAVKAMIDAQANTHMQSQDIQNTIAAKTAEQVKLLIEQNMNSAEVQGQITAALEQAKSGAASISALKEQLDSYNSFYTGLNQYTAGVASAKDGADALNAGASQLKSGTSELYAGMNELCNGIFTLKNGAPALVNGVTALHDGAMKLSDGLKEFNEQGVQKLVDAVDGDLNGLFTRVKATADVSKNYKSFSGISDDMDGQVKFIYRTDSIKIK
ncbi:MAG: hypothetical protein HFE78_00185 [Clostridiales bacterium]|nr:hypothetical protein [Clostridiales bacterium]